MSWFGPMSKKAILRGIEENIRNRRYELTDLLLSGEPLLDRDQTVRQLKENIAQLRQLKDHLETLL